MRPVRSLALAALISVATGDIDASVAFYGAVFAGAPVLSLPNFVAFDVAGGWFSVVSRDRYAPDAQTRWRAVLYLRLPI